MIEIAGLLSKILSAKDSDGAAKFNFIMNANRISAAVYVTLADHNGIPKLKENLEQTCSNWKF